MKTAIALLSATLGVTAQSCLPSQVLINYADSPDQMRVSWAAPCSAAATVAWGTDSSTNQATTGPAPIQYKSPGYTSPFLYHVTLKGLSPNTKYYYKVGAVEASSVFSFVSHPGDALVPGWTMAVVGDVGQTNNSASTLQHIAAGASNMVMHLGDISYADSDEPRWDSWAEQTQFLSSTLPYMVQVGNHENELVGGFTAYAARFAMPAPASGTANVWYSLNVAGVHWITLSNYHPFTSGSDQYNWLKSDLDSIDRTTTPWVFVNTHAPWYNTNSAHQGDGEAQRKSLEHLLYDAGVDAVFTGHVHAYERNHRAYNNARNPKGPVYITIGDGGNREGLATKWLAQTPVSAFRQATFGHGELVIVNATAAHWSWHTNPDAEQQTEDDVFFIKGRDV